MCIEKMLQITDPWFEKEKKIQHYQSKTCQNTRAPKLNIDIQDRHQIYTFESHKQARGLIYH